MYREIVVGLVRSVEVLASAAGRAEKRRLGSLCFRVAVVGCFGLSGLLSCTRTPAFLLHPQTRTDSSLAS